MAILGEYILSVSAAALICGMITSMVPFDNKKELVRMVCGLVMTVSIAAPLTGYLQIDTDGLFPDYMPEGDRFSETGEKIARDSMSSIITKEIQAYIEDKAKSLGLDLNVKISVSGDSVPVPEAVELLGNASPYLRLQLESFIEESLGITKENIRWKELTSKEAD